MVDERFRDLAQLEPHSPEYRRLRHSIIEDCLPIADHIARRFSLRGEPLEDLIQVARSGLICAVERFNPENGSEFVSFAVPTITGAVRRHFRDNTWTVKVPRGVKDLSTRINPVRGELTQNFGRDPTIAELAAELGVGTSDVGEALIGGRAYRTVPLHAPPGGDYASIGESLGFMDRNLEQVEDWEALRPLLAELPERERRIVLLRYFGLLTQHEIAAVIGVSQMHVCRLLAKALDRLRSRLERGRTEDSRT